MHYQYRVCFAYCVTLQHFDALYYISTGTVPYGNLLQFPFIVPVTGGEFLNRGGERLCHQPLQYLYP